MPVKVLLIGNALLCLAAGWESQHAGGYTPRRVVWQRASPLEIPP